MMAKLCKVGKGQASPGVSHVNNILTVAASIKQRVALPDGDKKRLKIIHHIQLSDQAKAPSSLAI